jgi:carbamoylphosphate synthase large subunit
MKNIVVAVFPSGSEVSIEISRALRFIRDIKLVGLASIADYGVVAFAENYVNLPFFNEERFLKELRHVVRNYQIDFLIPGMDEVAFFLKSHEGEIGCEVVYAKLETAKIIRKKSSTYDTLKEIIPTPIVYNSRDISASDLPIFSKPDIGYGSRGARKIETIEDFNKLTPFQKENNIFTEFLPGI